MREAYDRADEVLIGAQHELVDARAVERRSETLLPPSGGGGKAGTKAAVVRVDAELLAGLAVGQDHRTDVRQLSLARVRQSDGHGLVASRDTPQALLPSGGAEEIGDDEHE